MEHTERNVALACVCIGLALVLATFATGDPTVAAWSVLPLGLAAWMLYAGRS